MFNIVPCNQTWNSTPYIAQSVLDNFLCVSNFSGYSIGGTLNENAVGMLEFQFIPCRNSTANNNFCHTYDDIYNYIQNNYIYFYFLDWNINPQDYANPITQKTVYPYQLVSIDIYKEIELRFQSLQIITDEGFFLTSNTNITEVTLEELFVDVSTNVGTPIDILGLTVFQVFFFNDVLSISRSYIKVQNIFAYTGGVFSLLQLFFTLLNYEISKKMKYLSFLRFIVDNNLEEKNKTEEKGYKNMSIDLSKQDSNLKTINNETKINNYVTVSEGNNNNPNKSNLEINQTQQAGEGNNYNVINNRKSMSPMKNKTNSSSDNLGKMKERCKKLNTQFTFGYTSLELIKSFIMCRMFLKDDMLLKEELFDKIESKISKLNSIEHLFNMQFYMRYLKVLLLNKHQILSFKYLSKYILDKDGLINIAKENNNQFKGKKDNFIDLKGYFANNNHSEIDEKIFSFMSEKNYEKLIT